MLIGIRTKLMKIIELLIVKIFHWHSIWRGSISDMPFKVLHVANSKSPRFLLPLPLTSNLGALPWQFPLPGMLFPLLSAWLALSHYSSLPECHFHREVFSESLFKVLTLPSSVLFHLVALFYFLNSHISYLKCLWSELCYCILHGSNGPIILLILDPYVPRPGTVPGIQWY